MFIFLFIDEFFRERLIVSFFFEILIVTNVFVEFKTSSLNIKSCSLNMKSNSLSIWSFFVIFDDERDDVSFKVENWLRIFDCDVFFTKTFIFEVFINVSLISMCFRIDIWIQCSSSLSFIIDNEWFWYVTYVFLFFSSRRSAVTYVS